MVPRPSSLAIAGSGSKPARLGGVTSGPSAAIETGAGIDPPRHRGDRMRTRGDAGPWRPYC